MVQQVSEIAKIKDMQDGGFIRFRDRADAAERLAKEFAGLRLQQPIVLGIPRGGAVVGQVLARELGAEFDVVIARKLRVPVAPELAFGAVGEQGDLVLDQALIDSLGLTQEQVARERDLQHEEVQARVARYRGARSAASLEQRTVIVTDDGIATGSTMLAALKTVRGKGPLELIVAVPVAPRAQRELLSRHCDRVICLHLADDFLAVGQFYESFQPIEEQEVQRLLDTG